MMAAVISCRRLLTHRICCALVFAEDSAGNRRAARMAMMAMTTSNSINVNAHDSFLRVFTIVLGGDATLTGSAGQWLLSQRGGRFDSRFSQIPFTGGLSRTRGWRGWLNAEGGKGR